jgi:hypothetical protein
VVQVHVVLKLRLEPVIFIVAPKSFSCIPRRTEHKIGEIPAHAKTKKANKERMKYIVAQKDKETKEKRGYTPGIGGSMQFIW